MAVSQSPRFSPLLRWVGITLVVLFLLQMAAVLLLWDWQEEAFRQLVVERLINQASMVLIGLLLMFLASRVEDSSRIRPPLIWVVCLCSGLMAVLLTASLPIAFSGDQLVQEQSEQQLAAKRGQLEMARQQSQDPALLEQLIRQAEASGQVPPGASEEQKTEAARTFIERQLEQLETQLKQSEQTDAVAINQRRIAGSGGAIVLIVAFAVLCLASIL